jgi:cysteine desulfurase/selenocysteine lyase
MSINNINSAGFSDLSSFEPEAILAAVPGEHPRMAAALALGRQASVSGHLDVAELSRIANELYAEGWRTTTKSSRSTNTFNFFSAAKC